MSVLVLNATYEPLGVVSWQRAVCLMVAGRCEVLEERQGRQIRSAGGAVFPHPAVVRLTRMVAGLARNRGVPLTRNTLHARDRGVCQVKECDRAGSTIDHVVPRSRGGKHEWNNVVLMCKRHNQAKGDKTPAELNMKLKAIPKAPRFEVILTHSAERSNPEWGAWLGGGVLAT